MSWHLAYGIENPFIKRSLIQGNRWVITTSSLMMSDQFMALPLKNIFGYDMTGKQQQNKADDNKPKNNMLYFFHVHNLSVLSSNNV